MLQHAFLSGRTGLQMKLFRSSHDMLQTASNPTPPGSVSGCTDTALELATVHPWEEKKKNMTSKSENPQFQYENPQFQ